MFNLRSQEHIGKNIKISDEELFDEIRKQDWSFYFSCLTKDSSLLHRCDALGNQAIHIAAYQGNLEIISRLIEQGVDVNAENNNHLTALDLAASNGDEDLVTFLLEQGAKIISAKGKLSPLHWATIYGQTAVVRLLIKQGIDTNHADEKGFLASDYAKEIGYSDIDRTLRNSHDFESEQHDRNPNRAKLAELHGKLAIKSFAEDKPDLAYQLLKDCRQYDHRACDQVIHRVLTNDRQYPRLNNFQFREFLKSPIVSNTKHPENQLILAQLHKEGRFVKKDYSRSLFLYGKAATQFENKGNVILLDWIKELVLRLKDCFTGDWLQTKNDFDKPRTLGK
jgi:hypothetical protein